MHLFITTVLSLLFSYCLWGVETLQVISTLSVSNGGNQGEWGEKEFCARGYIDGFSLKLQKKHEGIPDYTGITGIRGYCSDGSVITSLVGKGGTWSEVIFCWFGYLDSFSLRVSKHQVIQGDITTVNNIKFKCFDGALLEGTGLHWGTYGEWSETCKEGETCGIQTNVEKQRGLYWLDHTKLYDVKFFCCK